MSAPTIPNLNTIRSDGRRGRGRGRGGSTMGNHGSSASQAPGIADTIVQKTDNDAASSRQSAVDAGYLEDPFSTHLNGGVTVPRRLPLMNRGTYVRTTCIDRIVDTFLSSSGDGRKQIISLGAGSDTRYFRLKRRSNLDILYHELDFEANVRRKIGCLRSSAFAAAAKDLTGIDTQADEYQIPPDESRLVSSNYVIHSQDLRLLPPGPKRLTAVDTALPTLVLSECCLIYLSPDDADAVIRWFSELFPTTTPLAIAIYEPIRPHDPFGKTMVSNLMSRGIQLQTLEKYSDLDAQRQRLETFGFGGGLQGHSRGSKAADIDFIWRRWIEEEEKERVEALEWMDEVEEFVLLAKHYCICWGWRAFEEDAPWGDLPGPMEKG